MSAPSRLSSRALIGWAVAVVFMFGMTGYHLFMNYTGLKNPVGMDQAQIAREVARGNGLSTKVIRPLLLSDRARQAESKGEELDITHFADTYHSPLNPLVNSVLLKLSKDNWGLEDPDNVWSNYGPDRLIVGLSMAFLLGATAVAYLLVSRIFDRKIGGVVAVLMILCNLMWEFSKSGMPQMLMLFLFMVAVFFLYKAVENAELELSTMPWLVVSGVFFGLLALSHWLTIWIFFGAVLYVAVGFRPRFVGALAMGITFLLVISPALVHNFNATGNIGGDARYVIFEGLSGSEVEMGNLMRSFNIEQPRLDGIAGRVLVTSIGQLNNIIAYMGAIFAAPLFFIALLHPFKRPEIAKFRWGLLLMWIFAVIGMTLFGLANEEMSSNQLHILFAPVMAGYGLALLAVLWSRLSLGSNSPLIRNGHLIIVIALSALPIFLGMLQTFKGRAWNEQRANYPYMPTFLNLFQEWVDEKELIVSDMPEGVAWYGDRDSISLPASLNDFNEIEETVKGSGRPVAGIHVSPISVNEPLVTGIRSTYKDWATLVTLPQLRTIESNERGVRLNKFAYNAYNQMYSDMYFWSNRNRSDQTAKPAQSSGIQRLEAPSEESDSESLQDFELKDRDEETPKEGETEE